MWFKIARLILVYRKGILVTTLLITLFMGYMSTKVRLHYSGGRILPESDSTYIDYENFKRQFGDDGTVLAIGIQTPDLFKLPVFKAWYNLGQQMKATPGVQNIVTLTNIDDLVKDTTNQRFNFLPLLAKPPTTQAQVDSFKQRLDNLPFYKGLIINPKNNATLMLLTLDRKTVDSKARMKLVQGIVAVADDFAKQTGVEVKYSGLPYIRTTNTKKVSFELGLFVALSILITAIVLFVIFRSVRAIAVPMVVVVLSAVWCLGSIAIFDYELTVLTGLIPPLIIIIGIPNCIFLTNLFHTEFKNHGNKIKAIARIIVRMGTALFLTNFNTALGFATFGFTQSKILAEFGIISSINVMVVFAFSIVLVPILFSFIDAPPAKHTQHLENKFMTRINNWLVYMVNRQRVLIYCITGVLLVVAVWGSTKIETTGAVTDDIPKNDKVYTDLKFIEQNFGGIMPFEVVIDTKKKKGVMKKSTLRRIDELQVVMAQYPEFSKPLSVVEFLKFANQTYYNGDTSFYANPGEDDLNFIASYLKNSKSKTDTNSAKDLTKPFLDSLEQKTRISFQVADIGSTRMQTLLTELKPRIDSIFPPEKFDVTLTGTSLVFVKGTDYLVENLLWSLLAAIVLISGLMAFMFYSFRMVLVSIIPNLIPLVFTAGIMGFTGIPLKSSTILVFNIAYGIAIDSAIHYFSVYGHNIKRFNQDIKLSVAESLRETGYSILYTSVILLFGFSIFIFSTFGGTVALGYLICITLFASIFTNLLLLPALLLSLDKLLLIKALREPFAELYDEDVDINLDALEIKKLEEGRD